MLAGPALAGPEEDLAARYAPVVRLVEQLEECGPGEPYEPSDVDAYLDEETVSLRGPWRSNDLVEIAPGARDLGQGLYEYNLDFPGDALNPGCDYERWARRISEDTDPTVYAHVVSEPESPGQLALQYWLFYAFNDWNNLHEGDWEMVQLVFEAGSVEEALSGTPSEIGYSQHEGGERAGWDDDKLELVDGTHPVVHPAAARMRTSSTRGCIWPLGGAGRRLRRHDRADGRASARGPDDPERSRGGEEAFPWIAFEGRWGERQKAFYNGPTGPEPEEPVDVPDRMDARRGATGAMPCPRAATSGRTRPTSSAAPWRAGRRSSCGVANDPGTVLAVLGVLLALVVFVLTRTTWRPTAPLRIARRRSWGQTLTASWRMYASRPLLFVGIGLITIPVSFVISLLQSVILRAPLIGVDTRRGGRRAPGGARRVAGTVLVLAGFALVQAATSRRDGGDRRGPHVGPIPAFRMALDSLRPLVGALAIAVAVVSLLSVSVFLVPVAIWLVVRWALLVPVSELERHSALGTLRRSGQLVRLQWFKVGTLVVVATALALVTGPFVGALLILVADLPFGFVNVLAALLYAVAMPFVAITTTYVFFDSLARERLEPRSVPAELPAEITL